MSLAVSTISCMPACSGTNSPAPLESNLNLDSCSNGLTIDTFTSDIDSSCEILSTLM